MQDNLQQALAARLIAMGDDELILGHRGSEWCGHAPILEEDIAFANLALDEIGHAMTWYGLYAEAVGGDPAVLPDELTYQREASEWRNTRFVELPRGDWAFAMLRQYLFDVYEFVMLEKLSESQHQGIAAAAAKIRKEEIYHHRHTSIWVRRLGLGTIESHHRMQTALQELWSEALGLFVPLAGDEVLANALIMPHLTDVQATWESRVRDWLMSAKLEVPANQPAEDSRIQHTEHLSQLLGDLQEVTREYPDQNW